MAHPIGDIAAGIVVLLAVCVSTMLVLPRPASEAPRERVVPDIQASVERSGSVDAKTNMERLAELEEELKVLAAEHRELREKVRTIVAQLSGHEHGTQRDAAP